MGEQIVCSNCLSNADSGLPACPYCGQSFENTNPAGTLPVNTLLAGRYTIGRVLALDGEGVLYAAIDNSATRRVVIKEYVPVTICAARSRDGSVIPCSPTRLGVRNSGFARVCVRHRQSGVRVCTHRVGMRQSCRSIRPSNRMGNQRADGNGMRMPAGDLFIRIPACQPVEACHPVDGDAGVHDALSVSYRAGARFPRRDR